MLEKRAMMTKMMRMTTSMTITRELEPVASQLANQVLKPASPARLESESVTTASSTTTEPGPSPYRFTRVRASCLRPEPIMVARTALLTQNTLGLRRLLLLLLQANSNNSNKHSSHTHVALAAVEPRVARRRSFGRWLKQSWLAATAKGAAAVAASVVAVVCEAVPAVAAAGGPGVEVA
jgi:hypothetical protein